MVLLVVIVAVIGGIKANQIGFMMDSGAAFSQPPETVSITEVETQPWSNTLSAVGSLEAKRGAQLFYNSVENGGASDSTPDALRLNAVDENGNFL